MKKFLVGLFIIGFGVSFIAVMGYVLVRTGHAAPMSSLDTREVLSDGLQTAPNELIIFSDYLCPACRRFFNEVTMPVLRPMVKSGRLRIVFVTFPIRPGSTNVSRVLLCAIKRKRTSLYAIYDHVYNADYQRRDMAWIANDLADARLVEGDAGALLTCAKSEATIKEVDRYKYDAILHGIGETPTVALNRVVLENPWNIKRLKEELK
ncbi:thioredoxin domain-containing protein [Frateuria sp. Soil773]|uniref:DsbA family protein n=1 Tax=Frateuria sp. Soil773 TaxID=1736407 RepID=UPI0009EB5463|nr:thioredoxin domain-containing protein [Frateuria sp. Soil773]